MELAATDAAEAQPTFSRDGRWFACSTDVEGRRQVYVASVADSATSAHVQVSREYEYAPDFSPAEDDLFYVGEDGGMYAVRCVSHPPVTVVDRIRLFDATRYRVPEAFAPHAYDVSKHGPRFVMVPWASPQVRPQELVAVFRSRPSSRSGGDTSGPSRSDGVGGPRSRIAPRGRTFSDAAYGTVGHAMREWIPTSKCRKTPSRRHPGSRVSTIAWLAGALAGSAGAVSAQDVPVHPVAPLCDDDKPIFGQFVNYIGVGSDREAAVAQAQERYDGRAQRRGLGDTRSVRLCDYWAGGSPSRTL